MNSDEYFLEYMEYPLRPGAQWVRTETPLDWGSVKRRFERAIETSRNAPTDLAFRFVWSTDGTIVLMAFINTRLRIAKYYRWSYTRFYPMSADNVRFL